MIRMMILLAGLLVSVFGQDWQANDLMFNPSGVPSLPFSQPRLADFDLDGDFDMILGTTSQAPLYFENTGTASNPAFEPGDDIFSSVNALNAEMGVGVDLNDDGLLDLVTGGYTGLHWYENAGTADEPEFFEVPDFFSELAVGANPVPAFADLDDDGDLDLLVGISEGGQLIRYPNSGTINVPAFLESESSELTDVGLYAYPWFVDLDGDGDSELLSGKDIHGFSFWWNVGSAAAASWQPSNAEFDGLGMDTYWNSPCLADLTGDGKADLLYGTASGPLAYYRNSGTLTDPAWTEVTSLFGGVLDVGGASTPVFVDFDGDGDLDLISGSQMGDMRQYRNTGTVNAPAWQADHTYFSSIDHSIYASITLADLDGDHDLDAVVGDLSGNLYYHRNTGSGFSYESAMFSGISFSGTTVPRLVDMNRDGLRDLVVGLEDGTLAFVENVGTSTAAAWEVQADFFTGIDVGSSCSPTLADYDGDGDHDLLTGDLFHELQYFENVHGDWVEDPSVVADLVVGQNAAPALADLDGDGDLDLTVGNYDGTFNYFENLTMTATVPEISMPDAFALSAYPNPFNPVTTLHFILPIAGMLEVKVYDVTGQQVALLVSRHYEAGRHAVMWEGCNAGGRQLSSGIYLVVLTANQHHAVQRVSLIR